MFGGNAVVGKMFWRSILLLLSGAALGILLLTLAYMLPVNLANKDASLETLDSEGWYPRASVTAASYDTYFHSGFPDVLDGSTDRIMLHTATDVSQGNPFLRALDSYNEYNGHYSYYWHGYVCILRPLLLLFELSELRIFNGICQFLLILVLAFVVGREKGMPHVLMLGTSYLLLNPAAVSMCLQFSWVFYIACLGTLALLLKREYFSVRLRYVYLFIVLGMLTSYCDLLTYPLFTWGMPLVWWLVMDEAPVPGDVPGGKGAKGHGAFYVKRVICAGFAWIAGYAGMWVMKWVIATPVLGRDIFGQAMEEVFFRAGAAELGRFGLVERLETVSVNWKHYEYAPYAVLLVCWLLWWFWKSLKNGGYRGSKRYACFLMGISGVVWCLVLSNHVQGHHFFTYRILGVSVLAFLALVLDNAMPAAGKVGCGFCQGAGSSAVMSEAGKVGGSSRQGAGSSDMPSEAEGQLPGSQSAGTAWREKRNVCCVWAAAVLFSIPFTLLLREDLLVVNGYVGFKTIPIEQNVIVEAEFTPAYNDILSLGLGLECPGTQGEYEIILWDGGEPEYREVIPIGKDPEAPPDKHYHLLEVQWKLRAKKTYRLTIEVKGNDAPACLWVTEDRQGPLGEYGSLTVGGEIVEGQPLSEVLYHCLPPSKKTLLFYSLTWTGILAAAMFTFGQGLLCRTGGNFL